MFQILKKKPYSIKLTNFSTYKTFTFNKIKFVKFNVQNKSLKDTNKIS